MNMELPQKNNSERKESLDVLKPITPELLLENPEILKKVYEVLTKKKIRFLKLHDINGNIIRKDVRYEYIDDRGLIDFGPEYEKTNLTTILFYFTYNTGLFSLGYDHDQNLLAQNYIKLLYEDKVKAKEYLEEQLSKRNEEQIKKCEIVTNGLNLSTIIPGAPELISQPMINGTKSSIGSMDTEKACFFINQENQKQLAEFFKGKTMIDLGAGSFSAGLKIAENLGAKNYIGVEPFNTYELLFSSTNELYDRYETNTTIGGEKKHVVDKVHIAKTDMRTFLQKLPDNMENTVFFISGVDDLILGNDEFSSKQRQDGLSEFEAGQQYAGDVSKELNRLVTKGNILVVYESYFGLSEENGFICHKFEGLLGKISIFEKA